MQVLDVRFAVRLAWAALPSVFVYRHCQSGSLAGAAHLLNDNEGVQRLSQLERKSNVENKVTRQLYLDFQ